jgi:hypothetical protein
MRKCKNCDRHLQLDAFYRNHTKGGFFSVCKKCCGERQKTADIQSRKKSEPLTLNEGEVFKEFRPNYLVSNYGRAYVKEHYGEAGQFIRGKFLKLTKLKTGYPCISYRRCKYTIHRIVAELFVKNPERLSHVNHKDGSRDNNHFKNLEWCTHGENVSHAVKLGSYAKKLTETEVMDIRSSKENVRQLSERYNVSETNINYILKRKIWKHV